LFLAGFLTVGKLPAGNSLNIITTAVNTTCKIETKNIIAIGNFDFFLPLQNYRIIFI
jgi:hypothetical protein